MSFIFYYEGENGGRYSISLDNDELGRSALQTVINTFLAEAQCALEVYDLNGAIDFAKLAKEFDDALKEGEAATNAEEGQPGVEVDNPE